MTQASKALWQGYAEDGEPIKDKGFGAFQCARGALHGAAHVWLWRKHNGVIQVLLQKRSESNRTWPGFIDASAAGHINFGEAPVKAVLREAGEEVGIDLTEENVELLFVHRQKMEYEPVNIIENEIQWVYGYDLTDEPKFDPDLSEVKSVAWVSLDRLRQLVMVEVGGAKLVPHDKAYFAELVKEIMQLSDDQR